MKAKPEKGAEDVEHDDEEGEDQLKVEELVPEVPAEEVLGLPEEVEGEVLNAALEEHEEEHEFEAVLPEDRAELEVDGDPEDHQEGQVQAEDEGDLDGVQVQVVREEAEAVAVLLQHPPVSVVGLVVESVLQVGLGLIDVVDEAQVEGVLEEADEVALVLGELEDVLQEVPVVAGEVGVVEVVEVEPVDVPGAG